MSYLTSYNPKYTCIHNPGCVHEPGPQNPMLMGIRTEHLSRQTIFFDPYTPENLRISLIKLKNFPPGENGDMLVLISSKKEAGEVFSPGDLPLPQEETPECENPCDHGECKSSVRPPNTAQRL
eukprot:802294-Amorphochlora_amoeboformis.AAC.2